MFSCKKAKSGYFFVRFSFLLKGSSHHVFKAKTGNNSLNFSKQKNKAPAGVALAKVKAFECEFGELAETDIFRKETSYARKHAEQWESARVDWSSQLERLALEFEAGEADLNPIDAKTCLYCDLQALCRINQVSSQNLEGVQDDE